MLFNFKKNLPYFIIFPTISFILSLVMTYSNLGFGEGFILTWIKSFFSSLFILPIALKIVGILESKVNKHFSNIKFFYRRLFCAITTSLCLETVLATIVTLVNLKTDMSFNNFWWLSFSASLPVGILIGLTMSFYVKPKLEKINKSVIINN